MTDLEAHQLVTSVLRRGEDLVWWQAAPSSAAAGAWLAAIGLTLFAVLFGGISFWAATTKRRPKLGRWQIAAFAVAFAALPAIIASYFWVQVLFGLERAYGITDQRVLIVDNRPWLWVNAYGPEQVMSIDRRGDTVSFNYGRTRGGDTYRTRLHGLREPERVEQLIVEHVRDRTPERNTAEDSPQ